MNWRGPENWRDRIDPAVLDVRSGFECAVGQVFREEGYSVGLRLLGLDRVTGLELASFGFLHLGSQDAVRLNEEWRKVLT